MGTISFKDFQKMDIRIAKILSAEKIEGTDKLLKLKVDIGEERQLVAGIAHCYNPEDLVGKQIPILANLEPAVIRGNKSEGMILAIDIGDDCILLHPNKEVPIGTKVV